MLLQPTHFYDLFLLGLKWLNEARDDNSPRARSLSPLLYTLRDIGIIAEKQRKAAMQDPRLRMKLRGSLHLSVNTPERGWKEDRELQIANGTKRLVIVLGENVRFEPSRLLSKHGYLFYIGHAGSVYAAAKEEPYANIVTRDTFVAMWAEMRNRVSTAMAAREARRPKASILQGLCGPIDLDEAEMQELTVA